MKKLLFFISLLFFSAVNTQNSFGFQEELPMVLDSFSIVDSSATLGKIVTHDLDQDGYTDLIFMDAILSNFSGNRRVDIKFIRGTDSGFNFEEVTTLISNANIITFFLSDWNKDGNFDLILRKLRSLGNGSYTSDLIEINFLNKTEIDNTLDFQVPFEIYLGNTTNPKELTALRDFDLDGYPDMLLIGFSHVTIGWNSRGGEPTFSEITNFGNNTYTTKIIDFNQDGYPDFINDDQYWKEPVVHKNNRNRTFTRKSLNLPKWSVASESSLYWNFETLWFDNDQYPDLLTQKANQGIENSTYKLYSFNMNSGSYQETSLQINATDLGILNPIHFNNDGFTDLAEVKKGKFRIWINDQNNSFDIFDINIDSGYELENFFNLDFDNDQDLDLIFSFRNSNILYLINNSLFVINSEPSIPTIKEIDAENGMFKILWTPSSDEASFQGHINYNISLTSDENTILASIHSDSIQVFNIPEGTYTVQVQASDPLGLNSESSISEPFIITSNSEQDVTQPLDFKLFQNYPNPFNPTTTIQFELDKVTFTKLTVYDVLGRKVQELVNEVRPAGTSTIQFDATNLASGIYLYRLEANGVVQTKRLTLIK